MSDIRSSTSSVSKSSGIWATVMTTMATTFFMTAAAGCFLSVVWGVRSWHQHSTAVALNQIDALLTVHSWASSPQWINQVIFFYRKSRTLTLQTSYTCSDQLFSFSQKLPAFPPAGNHINPFSQKFSQTCVGFKNQILPLLSGIAAVILSRLWILLTALPLFLFTLSLGLVDGLVQREIRKHQGARESTLLFHRIKRGGTVIFCLPLLAYFVWLSPVSPLWFLMPTAAATGLWLTLSIRYFKKYV